MKYIGPCHTEYIWKHNIHGLMLACSSSIDNAQELLQYCTKSSVYDNYLPLLYIEMEKTVEVQVCLKLQPCLEHVYLFSMITYGNASIVTGPFWGKSTELLWERASNVGFDVFFDVRLNTFELSVIWDTIMFNWHHCNEYFKESLASLNHST